MRALIGFNDLKSQRPDIACEYADDLNALKSDEIRESVMAWIEMLSCMERMESSGLKRWKEVNGIMRAIQQLVSHRIMFCLKVVNMRIGNVMIASMNGSAF